MKIKIWDISKKSSPSIHELRSLYRQNVDNNISDKALNLFKISELKRHLAVSIYKDNIAFQSKMRAKIIEKIALILGICTKSVERYNPKPKQ